MDPGSLAPELTSSEFSWAGMTGSVRVFVDCVLPSPWPVGIWKDFPGWLISSRTGVGSRTERQFLVTLRSGFRPSGRETWNQT